MSKYYLYSGQADLFIMLARPAYWQPSFANSMSSILKRTIEFIDQLLLCLVLLKTQVTSAGQATMAEDDAILL